MPGGSFTQKLEDPFGVSWLNQLSLKRYNYSYNNYKQHKRKMDADLILFQKKVIFVEKYPEFT